MLKIILKITLCTILILGCQEPTKKEKSDTVFIDSNKEGRNIDSLLSEYYYKGKLNGNVLVVKNGIELHHKSYGYSDSTRTNLLGTNYQFGIGSIFKEFPAVSIMKLKEKGLIKLEDKVDKYISELPSWSKEVSIKNLLQYTSGLPTIDWNKYFSKSMAVSDDVIMKDLLNIKVLEFKAGSNYIYTNNSPFLLIKIIEKVTNKSFKSYIQEEILSPLEMNGTQIKNQYPYDDRKFMAIPFDSNYKEDQYKVNSPTILFTSTIKDMSTWIVKLNSNEIISKESMNFLAKTAELENNNMQSPLGNCILKGGEIEEHIHHGSMGNYECLVQRFNKEDLTIVILTNQKNKNVFELSDSIISIVNKD